ESLGTHTTITACDAADPQALTHLLATVDPQHPLTAVIHTAGTLHDTPLTDLTPPRLPPLLTTKIHAAPNLHNLPPPPPPPHPPPPASLAAPAPRANPTCPPPPPPPAPVPPPPTPTYNPPPASPGDSGPKPAQ